MAGLIDKHPSLVRLLLIPLFSLLVGLAFLLTPLELKLSDLLMRFDRPQALRDDILLLNIDDESIENVGSFPWKRSVYADALYVLKNLGADAAVLDLNFVDPSPVYYDEDAQYPIYADEALADALRLFSLSGVGINMLDGNLPAQASAVQEKAAINVTADNDSATPVFPAVWPPVDGLMEAARSLGFLNAAPDSDGHARSIQLLSRSGGSYYGQLVFTPLLQKLGNPEVVVSDRQITIKDHDLYIPRRSDGSIPLCFPRQKFEDYRSIPIWNIIRIKYLEDIFLYDLRALIDSTGIIISDDENPLAVWEMFDYVRESLAKGERDEDITDELYSSLRADFFESCRKFLNASAIGLDGTPLFRCRESFRALQEAENKMRPLVEGTFCIAGTTATSTTDYGITLSEERYPNVGIHYVLANQILNNDFRTPLSIWTSIALATVLCLAYSLIAGRKEGAIKQTVWFILFVLLFAVAMVILLWVKKTIMPLAVPVTALYTDFIASLLFSFILTSREKSFIRNTFGRYVSSDVVNEILKDPKALELGGDSSKVRTAMFTDIQNFTTISENIGDSKILINFLNRYLTSLSDCIIAENGTIDKYEGDAIISFFGAPIYQENHAERACRAALAMKRAESILNTNLATEENWFARCVPGGKICTRIGINCGRFTVGNVGTLSHMNYTMIGSDVNLASRLEGANKTFGSWIIISQSVREQLGDKFLVRKLDTVTVVGAKTPIQLYELIALRSSGTATLQSYLQIWDKAFDLYTGRNYKEAEELFKGLYERSRTVFHLYPDDSPDMVAHHYMEDCQSKILTPPADDWNGVVELKQK